MSALEGLRVLDLTSLLPGPHATMILADFGAEVIKVERPGEGDPGRQSLPVVDGISLRFAILNRNKCSLALNLKAPEGREALHALVRTADVVVEGFRPGVAERLGIDYPTLSAIHPRLVYCSITGFGASGPNVATAGHDLNYLSLAGTLAMNGGLPPTQIADLAGGSLQAVIGILIALAARERTGRGQYVDVAMADGAFSLQLEALAYHLAGEPSRRGETRLTGRYPCYNVYPTRDDRFMAIGALERKFWKNLCDAVGRPDLVERQFSEGESGRETILALEAAFRTRTMDEWTEIMAGRDVCCTPVLDTAEAVASARVRERGLLFETEHPVLGRFRQLGIPFKLSATPATYRSPAPDLGQDSQAILRELGYSDDQIERLTT